MSPKIRDLLKASGCANVGELFDRTVRLQRILNDFKEEYGRPMNATELKCLEAVLAVLPPEKTHETF